MRLQKKLQRMLFAGVVIGIGFCCAASAEAPEKTPVEQVETMVILNETGIISITYADPWFWEVGYYAMSLWSFMSDSLDTAGSECAALSKTLADSPQQRLGARTRRILDSQLEAGRVKDIRVLSSLLKKHSRKNNVDPENSSNWGEYKALHGNMCSNLDPENPGYLQQMFFAPKNNPAAYFQQKCELIEKTVACLNDLNVIDKLNRRRQDGKEFAETNFSSNVFSLVSGRHADDDI